MTLTLSKMLKIYNAITLTKTNSIESWFNKFKHYLQLQ